MMSDPTPQTNLNKITELKGRMNVTDERFNGFMKAHEESSKHTKEAIEEMKKGRSDLNEHINELYSRTNGNRDLASANDIKLTAHEAVSVERNVSIQKSLDEIKSNLVRGDDELKQDARYRTDGWRWSIGKIVAIGMGLIGWFLTTMLFFLG